MNQYKRMVSYLYEYKQGVKGMNVGYVKIEERAGLCRVSLQMRGRNLGQIPSVALFHQEQGGLLYLPFGQLSERNGDYSCRIETEVDNLSGSGVSLQEVEGLILYLSRDYYVATTWKNHEIYLGEMREWTAGVVPQDLPADKQEHEETAAQENGAGAGEEAEAEENAASKAGSKAYAGEQAGAEENAEAGKRTGAEETKAEKGMGSEAAGLTGENAKQAQENTSGAMPGQPNGKNADVPLSGQRRNAQEMAEDPFRQGEIETQEYRSRAEEQAVCGNCPFKRKDLDYGKRMLMTFPAMRPFPNEQYQACVRIEPQDLGCLPMPFWALANNQFLLQGYYCYRHLLFTETGERKYALGVPGIYSSQDQEQARRFGFTEFRPICKQRPCMGGFGYWIMPLDILV